MTNDIESVIPGPAKQDLVDINSLLALTVEQVLKLVAASRQIDWGLGGAGNMKSLKELHEGLKQASDNQAKLNNQTSNYITLSKQVETAGNKLAMSMEAENKELISLNEARRQQNLLLKNEVIAENAAIGSLTHLRAQLNLTKRQYADLSAEVRHGDIGKQMLMQLQFFDAAVTKIENDMGVFARNVGNYNHMQHSTMQIMREFPNVMGGVDLLLMSLSNQWGAVTDAMAVMRKEGKSNLQIWKAFGASFFTMNSLIAIAVTGLMLLSKEAGGAGISIGKLNDEVEKDIDLKEKSIDLYAEELTHLKVLQKELNAQGTSFARISEIRDEIIKEYPKTAANLKDEKYLIADLNKTIGDLNKGLILHAQIKAAEELIFEKTKENLKGELSFWQQVGSAAVGSLLGQSWALTTRLEAVKHNNAEYKKEVDGLLDYIQKQNETLQNSGLGALFSDTPQDGSVNALRKQVTELTNLRDSVKANSQEYHLYNSQLQKVQKELDALTKTYKQQQSEEDKAAKLAAKRREEWRKGEKKNWEQQFKTQKNALESEMEANKALAEDERASYETRIDALEIYYDRKRELIDATADYEKWKGTKDAEDIETDRLTAMAELSAETLKIEADAAEDSLKLERDLEAQKIANLKSLAGYNKENADAQLKYDQEIARKRIQLIEKVAQAGKIALDFLADYRRDKTDAELYNLNLQDEENERVTAREIARIERSAMSATEKEEAIRQAEAKSDIQRQNIERQRADALQKQAAFERDMAIFTIMLDMYRGMSKEIGTKGVKGIITAAAISAFMGGLLMAANRVAAPKYAAYADGTPFHPYDGPAWVGDGGEPELISTPGGNSYWSPATDTLMNLPRGTSVTPMSQLIEESNGMLTPRLMNTIMLRSGGNTAKMEQLMGDVADGIERLNNKPAQRVTFANGFMQETIAYGHSKKVKLKKRI